MNTKTKSVLGAIVLAVGGVLASTYLPEGEHREAALVALAALVGWLGFKQPGQA